MYPILFKIGPFTIYTYGTLVAIAFLIGLYLAKLQANKEGISTDKIIDLSIYVLVSGILGARILYIITDIKYYFSHPIDVFKIWEGGLVYYGGFLTSLIVLLWYLNKKKLPVFKIIDIFVPSLVIGQAIGRLGCFFRGCCFGNYSKLTGLVFPELKDNIPRIPTQLIESAFMFLLFFVLIFIRKKKKYNGHLLFLYLVCYSIFRFTVEFFRGDFRGPFIFGLSVSQIISVLLFFLAFFLLRITKTSHDKSGKKP